MTTPLIYLAHPVGNGADRTMNIASTKFWLRALVEIVDDVAFSVPWLPYVEVLAEDPHRTRGFRDNMVSLDRCDGIAYVGGRFTAGMVEERDRMLGKQRMHIDLTKSPLPGVITLESYRITQSAEFRAAVLEAFRGVA